MKTLQIRIERLEDFGRAFSGALDAVKAGERREVPYDAVSFASYEDMHTVLAPPRIAIVKALAGQGPLAIREVARRVGRDVQAVHRDITKLINAGVVERTSDGVRFDYDRLAFAYDLRCSNRERSMNKSFLCKNGETVTIEFDEYEISTIVRDSHNNEIGRLNFAHYDYPDAHLKLVWAYLDKAGNRWLRQGIGRECLQFALESSGAGFIIAEEDSGARQPDGSHLTGDAPNFVSKMRKEGLIWSA